MRNILAFLLPLSLLLLFTACNICEIKNNFPNTTENEETQMNYEELPFQEEEDKVILRVGFFDSPTEVYYFVVTKNGIFEASLGNIWQSPDHKFDDDLVGMLGEIEESGAKQLTKNELEHIIEMANEIEKNSDKPGWEWNTPYGGWDVFMNYNDKLYKLTYYNFSPVTIDCFVEQLLILSPIQTPYFWESRKKVIIERGLKVDRWKKRINESNNVS